MRIDEDQLPVQTIDFSFNLMFALLGIYFAKVIPNFTTNSFRLNNNKILSTFAKNKAKINNQHFHLLK